MKTTRRTIGCRDIHREIEEAGQADPLSSVVKDHLKNCAGCETFYNEQFKLRQIVSSIGTVEAPGDFDFRLRARLAGEKCGAARPFAIANFSFGSRSAAFATVLLLVASTVLFVSLRPTPDNSLVTENSANEAKPNEGQPQDKVSTFVPGESDVKPPKGIIGQRSDKSIGAVASRNSGVRPGTRKSVALKLTEVASASNPRVATKDMGSTQAPILKPENMVAGTGYSVFPIQPSSQSLKVSLDDGRGSSKTISLPGVSFGSQRVLTQSAPPLLASARGAW